MSNDDIIIQDYYLGLLKDLPGTDFHINNMLNRTSVNTKVIG